MALPIYRAASGIGPAALKAEKHPGVYLGPLKSTARRNAVLATSAWHRHHCSVQLDAAPTPGPFLEGIEG
jgi:hypothetical protein